ncbi:hypothetical protein Mapa_015740 [Marchantia paleacea]|nr:hypothetical protein Mapa_015740 [Marchantia paleacea]
METNESTEVSSAEASRIGRVAPVIYFHLQSSMILSRSVFMNGKVSLVIRQKESERWRLRIKYSEAKRRLTVLSPSIVHDSFSQRLYGREGVDGK